VSKEVCPTCGHDQFMIVRDMTSRRIGKCGHEWPCPEEPRYQAPCGQEFKEPYDRVGHSATCGACKRIADLNKELRELKVEHDKLFQNSLEAAIEHPCYKLSKELEAENKELLGALNRIAMLGMGADAYTKDFTEKVNMIARGVLEGK